MVQLADHKIDPNVSADEIGKPEWAAKAEKAGYTPKKTIGEKIFDAIAYVGIGDVLVFIGSVGLAYGLKYSSKKVPGTKDTTWAQGWENVGEKITKTLKLDTDIDKDTGKKRLVNSAVEDALMTTALMMPGNLAILPIRWMEKRKTEIVKGYNEKFGNQENGDIPSDVEAGQWNTKSEAMQSWGTLLKGRVAAWLTVFASLTIFSKIKPTALPKFMNKTGNLFEDAAVKMNLADKPAVGADRGPKAERSKNNRRAYFFGEIASIDFFADIAAVAILYIGSKFFAKQRDAKQDSKTTITESTPIKNNIVDKVPSVESPTLVANKKIMPKKHHRQLVEQRDESFTKQQKAQSTHAKTVETTQVRV